MTNKIMAIALVVADLKKAIDFYQNKLGLKLKTNEEGFADFETEGTTLALLEKKVAEDLAGKEKVGTDSSLPRSSILAWDAVEDVDILHKELKDRGVEFTVEPKTMSWGQRVAYFSDPDGNLWEISQWVK